jgi:hypothetical protein
MRSISVILISLFLAACQATTSHLMSQQQMKRFFPCEPILITEASVNWAVFGRVINAKNCPGRGGHAEHYELVNGWGVYQEASSDYMYYPEVTERSFRDSLATISNKLFSDIATTTKIYNPYLKLRPVMFAQRNSFGKEVIVFVMNSSPGHGYGSQYGKFSLGMLSDDSNMSPEDFREYFLKRLRVFDTSRAESFIASTAKQATTVTQSLVKGSIEKRLNELKKLLEQELLTKDEAAAKRKEILGGL